MNINPTDGRCRSCGGELRIIDATDATLLVLCTKCDEEYEVETDAFKDGGVIYYPAFMAAKLRSRQAVREEAKEKP